MLGSRNRASAPRVEAQKNQLAQQASTDDGRSNTTAKNTENINTNNDDTNKKTNTTNADDAKNAIAVDTHWAEP